MRNVTFKKGDILWVVASQRDPSMLKHPAVVWDETVLDADFLGIMLTHSEPNGRYDNIQMAAEHFEPDHQIGFENTHFVNQLFIKFREWGPFHKCGALTLAGIEFIECNLTNTHVIEYERYVTSSHDPEH